jgi:ubiquinone/menaquinone biosynthesis C-methylase UbiE
MDARDLKYGLSTFDLVVDKAMMDSLLCGDSPFLNVAVMLKEVQRVLKTGGVFILVTYGDPESRMSHLTRGHLNFDIKFQCLKKSYYIQSEDGSNSLQEKTHYIYLCKNKTGSDFITNNNFQNVFCELERGDVIGFDQEDEENFGDEII